jgi:protein-S-isoprenylcysteine O-methyltransferase Ste14
MDLVFRLIFLAAAVAFFVIRIISQRRVAQDVRAVAVHERPASLIAGVVAALTALVFGAEYLVAPGTFGFAYVPAMPLWLRWVGALLLVAGVTLLGWAHRHLDRNFHSLVVSRPGHVLIQSGPYRIIRHPIYTAYLLAYGGGGLLAANWVLAVIATVAFALLVVLRLPQEEALLLNTFGDRYRRYIARTGALLPRVWKSE